MLSCLQLPEDGGPLTVQWMQTRLEQITLEQAKMLNEKCSDNTKLARHKVSVLSELEKLRALNKAHRRLMVEIWQHLTALARVGMYIACSLQVFHLQHMYISLCFTINVFDHTCDSSALHHLYSYRTAGESSLTRPGPTRYPRIYQIAE